MAPGDEIIETITGILTEEAIQNASFSGIGALKVAELAHYRVDTRKYSSKVFEEPLEIASMTGNAFLHDNKPLVHVHAVLANDRFETIGGHLVKGVVSAACEIVLFSLESSLEKKYSEEIGLKVLPNRT